MSQILITEFMDEPAVESLRQEFDVRYEPTLCEQPAALVRTLAAVEALIVRNRTQVRGSLLEAALHLRVVGRLGVGLDNIDLDACRQREIRVIPATGANAQAVAEYVIGALFVLMRGCYLRSAEVADGHWPRAALSGGWELSGRTLGLVGFGDIGQRTAALALALGMRVVACDPRREADPALWQERGVTPLPLPQLLAESDAISLHIPATPQNQGLIGVKALAAIKPGAVLINTARGEVLDTAALVAALRSGRLRGAALDVHAVEPLPAGILPTDLPNLVLSPHVAGLSQEANTRVSELVGRGVAAALRAA